MCTFAFVCNFNNGNPRRYQRNHTISYSMQHVLTEKHGWYWFSGRLSIYRKVPVGVGGNHKKESTSDSHVAHNNRNEILDVVCVPAACRPRNGANGWNKCLICRAWRRDAVSAVSFRDTSPINEQKRDNANGTRALIIVNCNRSANVKWR